MKRKTNVIMCGDNGQFEAAGEIIANGDSYKLRFALEGAEFIVSSLPSHATVKRRGAGVDYELTYKVGELCPVSPIVDGKKLEGAAIVTTSYEREITPLSFSFSASFLYDGTDETSTLSVFCEFL